MEDTDRVIFNVGLCWYNVLFLFNHLLILKTNQQKLEDFLRISHIFYYYFKRKQNA